MKSNYSIQQLVFAMQRNDGFIVKNGVRVHALTGSEKRDAARYVARTAKRIAWQMEQKRQAQQAAEQAERADAKIKDNKRLVQQRSTRVVGMNSIINAGRS